MSSKVDKKAAARESLKALKQVREGKVNRLDQLEVRYQYMLRVSKE